MLGTLCLVLAATLPVQEQPRGRCIWTTELPGTVVDWLTAPNDDAQYSRAADIELLRHARMHGWSGFLDEPSRVPADREAQCPDAVLEVLTRSPRWCDGVESEWPCHGAALCLVRNGRTGAARDALDQLVASHREARASGWLPFLVSAPPPGSCIAELAARLAARDGDWDLALEYARDWWPPPSCLGPPLGEFTEPVRFRLQCMTELGWTADACVLRDDFNARFGYGDSAAAQGPELELFAGLVPGIPLDEVTHVKKYWKRVGRPPGEWLATPELLAFAPPIAVRRRLRDLSDAEMEVLVAPLLDNEWTEIDRPLAYQLAWTGHRPVGPALDHVVQLRRNERDVGLFESHRKEWAQVRAWLDELSQP